MGIAIVAMPPDKVTGTPKAMRLSLNTTLPVGVPDPGPTAATVAVKVTGSPNTDGLTDEVTAVVVDAPFTV